MSRPLAMLVVLALAVAGILALRQPASDTAPTPDAATGEGTIRDGAGPREADRDRPAAGEVEAREAAGFWEERPRAVAPDPARVGETPTGFPSERFRPAAYEMGRMAIFGSFWREAEASWDAGRYAIAESERETLDGRQSYQVYVYLRTCLDAPRTDGQVDRFLEQIDRAASGDASERQLRRIQRVLDRMDAGVARCAGLPERLEPLALDWLTQAATKGYPLAQIAFYRSYRWISSRQPWLVFGEHDRIATYRRLAPGLLEAALGSGHAEAFAEMAQALADGIIFDTDEPRAYAYALAAEMADHGATDAGADLRARLAPLLDGTQRREARDQARTLCDRYCL